MNRAGLKLFVFAAAALLPSAFALGGMLSGPQTFTVSVGGEAGFVAGESGQVPTWELMNFYPYNLTVNVGDTIDYKLKTMEFHNVTVVPDGGKIDDFVIPEGGTSQRMLINPAVANPAGDGQLGGGGPLNSGLMQMDNPNAPQEYKLTAAKPGDYLIVCEVHSANTPAGPQGMVQHVHVNPAGTAYPRTPDEVAAQAADQLAVDSAEVALFNTAALRAAPGPKQNADGTMTYTVNAGFGGGPAFADWMRFGPSALTVNAGDSVTFVNVAGHTPHTASLLSGGKEPDTALVEPQPAGPPKLVLNPLILAPAGGNTYAGTGYFNSGFLPGPLDEGPHSVTVTFTQPGTYEYTCLLHDQMGMHGTITVNPKPAASGSSNGG